MRAIKKIAAFAYLLAAAAAIACLMGIMASPDIQARVIAGLERPALRIALLVCTGIVALGVLITSLRLLLARREPDCVHPDGNPDVEVRCAALASTAKVAAEAEGVYVESVRCRVMGAGGAAVRFTLDVVAFTDVDLRGLALRIQRRVEGACSTMLGAAGVEARVRFLPAKTTVVTKEVPRERA